MIYITNVEDKRDVVDLRENHKQWKNKRRQKAEAEILR